MTAVLSTPGELHTVAIGNITLTAQLTVDGGVTITAGTGPDRHHSVSWTYADRALARRRYAQIRQLAATGLTAQQIADSIGADREHAVNAVRGILDEAMQTATADNSTGSDGLVTALQQTVAECETPAERAANDVLAASIRATLAARNEQPVADQATAYLAGIAAQRQARIEQAVTAADAKPTTLDAYVGNPARVNARRLASNTPSSRRLSQPMRDMLAELHHNAKQDRGLTVTSPARQRTARALDARGLVGTRREIGVSSMDVWLVGSGHTVAARIAAATSTGKVAA